MGVRLQVFGVVLLGLLVSGGAGLLMHRVEMDNAGQALDRRVAAAQESVASTAQRYVDAVQLTAGSLEALPKIDAASFTTATAPLGQLWLPGATSIDLVVSVPDSSVAAAQADWRALGAAGLTLRGTAGVGRHYFTVLQRTLGEGAGPGAGADAGDVGQDLTGSAEASAALERAGRIGLPAISDPYVLPRDTGLPPQDRQQSVVLLQRVVDRVTGELRGFVQMTVRMQDFFVDTMLQPSRELLDVTLSALDGSGWQPMARMERHDAGAGDLRRTVLVQVADQQWQLAAGTDGTALIGADGHLDEGMVFGGLALTLVTALLVYTLATSRRRAEDRVTQATADLRHQATLLSAVMNTIGDGVVVFDPDGAAVWVNPTARGLLGHDIDRHPPAEWPELLEAYEADGVTPYQFRALVRQQVESQIELVVRGRRLDVRLRTLVGQDGAGGAVAVLRDVTELHEADEKVRASEELLQLLLDGARDYAIYMLDRQGVIESWSGNAERLTGYRADEAIGHSYGMFFTAEEGAAGVPRRILDQAAEHGRVEIDGPRVRRNGSRFWAHGLLTAVRHPDGTVRGFVKVSQDITERKTAERAVEQLNAELEVRVAERTADLREANAELESFSYSVSHDLRAPLRAVDGFAKMLALDHGDALDEQGRRYLARIRAGAQHMGDLIDGLLAFSRLQRQEMASLRVHLDQLVADVWEELGVERGTRDITLSVGDLPDAQGDPRLIRHVVANLVGNAVKYTRDVSPARIEIGHRVGPLSGEVMYYVKDNGAGFDMRYADKLFKVFQRLHRAEDYEGTGIGLALTHRIVLRHGGQIWADAVPGEGATFYFTLPAYENTGHTGHMLLEVGG
ncbi:PAS domain S-box protein [Dactylosporangium siamense]|uniref:PAS domain S-box protein n=1 Tax=Dactylosporangium siamense TaxID=685454 RepID=UPI00194517A6|nr:PAS domain S-box protein [Dactylosporangium siamense]